jgi:hypothetical protein
MRGGMRGMQHARWHARHAACEVACVLSCGGDGASAVVRGRVGGRGLELCLVSHGKSCACICIALRVACEAHLRVALASCM